MSVKLGSLRQRLLAGAIACAACATASSARAQEPTAEPKQHVVKRGDTLWDIAHAYLGNAFLWPRIYDSNKRIIKDPHWIYPGQRFTIIPGQNGEPATILLEAPGEERSRFYRPPQGADTTDVGEELRPSVERGEYLATPWIGDPERMGTLGRMLDRVKVEGRADRLAQIALIEDRLYVRVEPGAVPPTAGTELVMVRVDRALPPYGTVLVPTALLVVERSDRNVIIVRMTRQFGPVLRGQRVMPVPAFTAPGVGAPRPVERGVEGELVGLLTEQPLHTISEQGFVSIGRAQGLKIGDVLEVYAPARPTQAAPDVLVPAEQVARVLVSRLEDRTATVRVLSMSQPSLQPGLRVRLAARVP